MDSPTSLFFGVIFGAVGVGYFIYGRKQRRAVALLAGVILCIFPYFVSDPILILLIGIAAMALPYFFRY